MATLTNRTPAESYKDLLQVSNENAGVDATLRSVEDGEGTSSALQLSTTAVKATGTFQVVGDSSFANITAGVWQGTAIGPAYGGLGLSSGTSGGILAFTDSTTLASSAALTAGVPVIGGGAGAVPTVATGLLYAAGGPHLTITAQNAAYVPLVLKGAASQTGYMFECRDSSDANLFRIQTDGAIYSSYFEAFNYLTWVKAPLITGSGSNQPAIWASAPGVVTFRGDWTQSNGTGALLCGSPTAATVGLTVKGAASQTANLLEAQDSSSNVKLSLGYTSGTTTFSILGNHGQAFGTNGFTIGTNGPYPTLSPTGGAQDGNWQIKNNLIMQCFSATYTGPNTSPLTQIWLHELNTSAGINIVPSFVSTVPTLTFNAVTYGVGTTNATMVAGRLTLNNPTAGLVGLTVKAAASQSAHLQQWQNSSGTVLASIGTAGQVNCGTVTTATIADTNFNRSIIVLDTDSTHATTITGQVADRTVFSVKGASSQTANLQEWQNSAGTALSNINASGHLYIVGANASSYTARIGNFAIQPYDTSNIVLACNSYYNNGWARIVSGYASQIQFLDGSTYISNSNTGSGSHSPIYTYKSDFSGSIGLGGNISTTASTYTGAFLFIDTSGQVAVNATSGLSAQFAVVSASSSRVGAVIKGAASQSANLQEWQNSSGTAVAYIASDYNFYATRFRGPNNGVAIVDASVAGIDGLQLGSNALVNWSNNASFFNTADLGLARSASGVLKVTNGSSGTGDLELGKLVSFKANIKVETGTTYTLLAADTGKILEFTNGSAVTVTLPDTLPVGFTVTIVQAGAGQITLSPDGAAGILNARSHVNTYGQEACTSLYVTSNPGGTAATYRFSGDTA